MVWIQVGGYACAYTDLYDEKGWVGSKEVWGHKVTSVSDRLPPHSPLPPTCTSGSMSVTFLLTLTRYLTNQFKGKEINLSLYSLP